MIRYQQRLPAWKETRPILFRMAVFLGDWVCVGASYSIAYSIRFFNSSFLQAFPNTKPINRFSDFLVVGPIILLIWTFSLSWNRAYNRINFPAIDEGLRLLRASFLGSLLSMSAMFLYRDVSYSRLVFVMGGGGSFFAIYLFRQTLKSFYLLWIRQTGRPKRILVLGNGYLSNALQKILERQGDCAVIKKHHFKMDELIKTINRSRIDEVLVAKTDLNHNEANKLANFCEDKGVQFRLLPDILELRLGEVLIDESLGIPTFQLKPVSLHGTAFFTKRLMDLSLSAVLLGMFFIPFALIALLIKLTSKGPIFYFQERMGYKSRPFQFMKFRTMISNAESLMDNLRVYNERPGPVFKMKADPRVTWVGRILRRLSLDEIPQLINVLKGDMSLIGPRPQILWEAEQCSEWAKKRLNVLPGITGLWQVSGRAELTYEEMIEMDIFYIEHWSPGLDIKILAKTLPAVIFGKGAY